MRAPAPAPCVSCPYRRDVPSGVWDAEEYAKLPGYDLPLPEQPTGIFACHQQDGRVCAGWAGTHDMDECLALRLAASADLLDADEFEATRDYESPVPLFASGGEAAEHGLRDLEHPDDQAVRAIRRLQRKSGRRATA